MILQVWQQHKTGRKGLFGIGSLIPTGSKVNSVYFFILIYDIFIPFFLHTQVGSRLVLQTTGILMIILGVFGKFGAVFITIPDPVIGGMFLVMFGMIAAVGISNLQVNIFDKGSMLSDLHPAFQWGNLTQLIILL